MKFSYYLDLISVLVSKELKLRYKNSFLGYLWSVANPLMYAGIFFVAFKVFMRIKIPNYTVFLISGLFPWQAISNSIGMSTTIYIGNASLIKKLNFPRFLLPISVVVNNIVHYLLSLLVVFSLLFINGINPSLFWLFGIPFLLFFQFLITAGFALIVSTLNPFVRDLEHIVALFLNLIFYLTPIVYSESMIPGKYKFFLLLNPFAPLIISWRDLFLKGTLNAEFFVLTSFHSILVFLIGFLLYFKLERLFAEVV